MSGLHPMRTGRRIGDYSALVCATHVREIAAEERIEIVPHSSGGRAWRRIRRVAIRPVKSAVTYAVGLHELGHVLGPWQSRRRLSAEVGAWVWAEENALVWTPRMAEVARDALRNYLRYAAGTSRRRSGFWAAPDAEFADVYGRIGGGAWWAANADGRIVEFGWDDVVGRSSYEDPPAGE